MKNLKKLASLALALVMALALMVPAFAADTDPSITINNPKAGMTYEFYKIFDMTSVTTGTGEAAKTTYSYEVNADWEGFFKSVGEDGTATYSKYLTSDKSDYPITFDGQELYINLNNKNIADFANDAFAYMVKNDSITAAKSADGDDAVEGKLTVDLTESGLGYYLVYPVGASQALDGSASVCSLTVSKPNADVSIKAEKPTIEKTSEGEKAVSADVGTEVPFTVKGKVPNTAGFETYTYKVADTMSAGLTFNEDVTVMIGDEPFNPSADQLTYTENGFTLSIPVMDYQDEIGAEIVISYSATVNADAVTEDKVNNTATLNYSNDPTDGENTVPTTPEEVEVYTSKIVINKIDSAGAPLSGATFALKSGDKYYTLGENGAVSWKEVENVDDLTDAQKFTSDANGVVEFKGLKDGTYSLVETAAPAGYNKLAEPVEIVVDGTKKDYKVVDGKNVEWDPAVDEAPGSEAVKADGQVRFLEVTKQVINLTGAELPETGGIGTTIFYTMGALLVVSAGILLVAKKRMACAE